MTTLEERLRAWSHQRQGLGRRPGVIEAHPRSGDTFVPERVGDREADEQAIQEVARAYLESWLDGDGERMRGALHPMLAKRGLDHDATSAPSGVHHLDASYMIDSAARGPRRQFARTCDVTILDLADNVASVKVVSEPFVDYLHLVKLDSGWSIVNALYEERRPGPR